MQTQIVFNVERMREFTARAGELGLLGKAFILGGVFVLRSARAARYLRDQVPGIDVPDETITRMEGVAAEHQPEEGVRMAIEIVQQLREMHGIAGVHVMSINWDEAIPRVVEGSGLLPRPSTDP